MKIESQRFGSIEVKENQAIEFDHGLLGFPDSRLFYIIQQDPRIPLLWLQDANDPSLAFVIIEPRHFRDYCPSVSKEDMGALNLNTLNEAIIYSIVVIPQDPRKMTANLKAPLVINPKNRKAMQVIVEDERYRTRHSIIQEYTQAVEARLKAREDSIKREAREGA